MLGGGRCLAQQLVVAPYDGAIVPADLDMQYAHLETAFLAGAAQTGLHLGRAQGSFDRLGKGHLNFVTDGFQGFAAKTAGDGAQNVDAQRQIGACDGITVLFIQTGATRYVGVQHGKLFEGFVHGDHTPV